MESPACAGDGGRKLMTLPPMDIGWFVLVALISEVSVLVRKYLR